MNERDLEILFSHLLSQFLTLVFGINVYETLTDFNISENLN